MLSSKTLIKITDEKAKENQGEVEREPETEGKTCKDKTDLEKMAKRLKFMKCNDKFEKMLDKLDGLSLKLSRL